MWFLEPTIPVGYGQLLTLPALVITLGFSRLLTATMVPSRQAGDILGGMWQLFNGLGMVPKDLIWDRESAIGGTGIVTVRAASFAGSLSTRIQLAPPWDPKFKGMVQRNNGFFETSLLPGCSFASPADFSTQLDGWLPNSSHRVVRFLGQRPDEVLPAELEAMTLLPVSIPSTRLRHRMRLGQAYYVRVDSTDYSVDSRCTDRFVDIYATATMVTITRDGEIVGAQERCWARRATISDPGHVSIAKTLRKPSPRSVSCRSAPAASMPTALRKGGRSPRQSRISRAC